MNPHNYFSTQDSRSIAVRRREGVSNEQLLARFVKGFFGGRVLAPERIVLSGLGRDLVGFEGKLCGYTQAKTMMDEKC